MLYHINRIILSNIRLNFCVQSDVFVFFQKCFGLYTENLAKIFCFVVVIMKGNKSPPLRQRKAGEKMKPGKHEIHKQHTFDCYCKRVLKNEACNIQKEYSRRRNKEISFDELSEQELQSLCVSDEYFADEYIFDILGGSVTVRNERLAKALQSLTERKRDIILLSYFLDMTDREIAEKLNMVRKTVQYQRTSSLKALKKRLEDSSNEQDDNK